MFEVLKYFLTLGCLSFGGPLATIATMQRDLVETRKWIGEREFIQLFALVKAMPGPISFQIAIYLASKRAGRLGGIVAAIAFMFPSFCLMIALAMAEKILVDQPFIAPLLRGFQAAAMSLIALSLRSLFVPYRKDILFWCISVIVAILSVKIAAPEPVYILLAGLFALGLFCVSHFKKIFDLGTLFLVCAKAGALVFGTGLAIVPLLEQDFVQRLHWVTHNEFLNALAYGQVTPGPVVISATYLGFLTHGWKGAIVATIGIFLPSALHMLTWFPYFMRRWGEEPWLQAFARGAIAAVAGLMTVFCLQVIFGWDWITLALFMTSAGFLAVLRTPAWLLVPACGILSWLLFTIPY
jgi:chromate transporter